MKAVNVILAIGTLFILGALITLGIKTFYPEPTAPPYQSYPVAPAPCSSLDPKCQAQESVYAQQEQAYNDHQQQIQQAYQDQMNNYDKNLFIIANIVGIIIFALGFWLVFGVTLASQGVPIGIMMAGLWGIIYGYFRGWGSVDDSLKFFVGLVVAVLVIGGSMWLTQRYQKKVSA